MNNITKYFFVLLLMAGVSSGCESFLSPSVEQNKPTETAIQNESDLEAVVYGAYDDLNRYQVYGRDFYVSGDVMSDNAWSNANSGRFVTQDLFNFTANSGYAEDLWDGFYEAIAGANLAIHADLESSSAVDQSKGQAYALRAFSHMNLLLAFGQQHVDDGNGGIPYITEYKTAEEAEGDDFIPGREDVETVWSNIEDDLSTAADLLDSEPESFNPVELEYWAVRALQTRYYLYTEQYDEVVTVAEEIINSGLFEITTAGDLVAEWESGSGPESLFELAFTSTDRLGTDNISRIYRNTNYGDVEVTSDLYDAHASDDVRFNMYTQEPDDPEDEPDEINTRMASKYSDELGTDNVRIIRYAEVVLNYAEALANGASGEMTAQEALEMLTENRYEDGSPYATVTVDDVLFERRLELAMEGHRFYDLARTGQDIPAVDDAGISEDLPYGDFKFALPIPDREVRANSNIEQNAGY